MMDGVIPMTAPPMHCLRCGAVVAKGLGRRCVKCLNQDFLDIALRRQGFYFRGHPQALVDLAHDRHKVLHAILKPFPKWAFCGAVPNEPKSKRKQAMPERLPGELCAVCRELVEREWKGAIL